MSPDALTQFESIVRVAGDLASPDNPRVAAALTEAFPGVVAAIERVVNKRLRGVVDTEQVFFRSLKTVLDRTWEGRPINHFAAYWVTVAYRNAIDAVRKARTSPAEAASQYGPDAGGAVGVLEAGRPTRELRENPGEMRPYTEEVTGGTPDLQDAGLAAGTTGVILRDLGPEAAAEMIEFIEYLKEYDEQRGNCLWEVAKAFLLGHSAEEVGERLRERGLEVDTEAVNAKKKLILGLLGGKKVYVTVEPAELGDRRRAVYLLPDTTARSVLAALRLPREARYGLHGPGGSPFPPSARVFDAVPAGGEFVARPDPGEADDR